ncbi:MAG: hypothetical protein PF447_08510 [Spirochaetaceae bacterium]|jgi:hypothetical protein|nr:hypothetical protein [Spirochaetaceae bacterium]
MKKLPFLAILFIFSAFLAAQSQDYQLETISLENQSGEDLWYIFVSPSDSEIWGPDIMGYSDILNPGGEFTKYFYKRNQGFGLFDIMAISEYGQVYEAYRIPLNIDGSPLEITQSKSSVSLGDDTLLENFTYLTIKNDTKDDLWYLFIAPLGSQEKGFDLLNSEFSMGSGEEISFNFQDMGRSLDYTITAMDSDERVFSFDLTLLANEESQYAVIEDSDLVGP